jgi:hypothetical protein
VTGYCWSGRRFCSSRTFWCSRSFCGSRKLKIVLQQGWQVRHLIRFFVAEHAVDKEKFSIASPRHRSGMHHAVCPRGQRGRTNSAGQQVFPAPAFQTNSAGGAHSVCLFLKVMQCTKSIGSDPFASDVFSPSG